MKRANQLLAGSPKKPKPDPYTKTNKIINKIAHSLIYFSLQIPPIKLKQTQVAPPANTAFKKLKSTVIWKSEIKNNTL